MIESNEPIHDWFGLTYSSYLVIPRTILQSMPVAWQRQMVALLDECRDSLAEPVDDNYTVLLRAEDGRVKTDPLRDYERGRRRVEMKE